LASVELTADTVTSDTPTESLPPIPTPSTWPGALLIAILGWFGMAAVIGIVVQTNAPLELLPKRSKTEPPPDAAVTNDAQ